MCGICGVIQLNGESVDDHVLAAMVTRLSSRGPDAQGTARPLPWIGLGHARLKVIDLTEAASQPMSSHDRQTWIVYNGEVYNYQALRTELQGYGRQFRSHSDTEVILQAYEQWGEDCLQRLDGMFAFGILDLRQRRLLLARDRTGKKPLYYYRDQVRVAFASEPKALLIHPAIPCAVRHEVLPAYLVYGYVPSPETFFKGIVMVPPASALTVDLSSGAQRQRRYWRLVVPATPPRVSREEAVREIRQRMTEAVRKRLVADVPLGAFLSGGVDSSIVVGIMSRLLSDPVHTFSIGFRGDPRYDETAYARVVAQRFHTRHTEFVVQPRTFDLIERLIYHHDQPFGDASAIPTFLLCALAKEHVTVALNGDGGDELFAGYRRFIAAVLSTQVPSWMARVMARLMGTSLTRPLHRMPRYGSLRRFCDALSLPWDQRLVRWAGYFPDPASVMQASLAGRVLPEGWLEPVRRWLAEVRQASPLAQALYVNFHEYLPNDLHIKMDRCSMAHGLETRSPFLDTAVIEYVAALPDAFKLRGFRTKIILKEAFADLLPALIQRRGKWGFGVPLDAWFRTELRTLIPELLLSPTARLRSYVDQQAIRHLWDVQQRGERDCGLLLWSLATLEIWLQMMARRVFTDQTTQPAPWSKALLSAEAHVASGSPAW